MTNPLSVLIVEDNPSDSCLLVHALREAGFDPACQRVDTEADYLARLDEGPDVILCDFNLPQFSALEALALLRGRQLDIPFIVVSGSIGEDIAVNAIQQGATDYLLKDRLGRLGQAVARALDQKRLRERNREADRRKTILLAVSHALARSRTLDEACGEILQAVCENTGLQIGAFWEIDVGAKVLRCLETWHVPSADLPCFEATLRSITFSQGVGLPGRVWETGKPLWIQNLASYANFPRAPEAAKVGLHAGLGFPILIGSTVRGVYEFFGREIGQPDTDLLEMFAAIGEQIGQFVERMDAEDSLRQRVRVAALSSDVGIALTKSDTLQAMLQACADSLVRQLGGTFARIWTLNKTGDVLELHASAGLLTHIDKLHDQVPVGKLTIGLIAQERRQHVTNDVCDDPRVGDDDWARREGMKAFAGYPLLVEDRLMGVMAMFARQPMSAATLEAMAAVANQIALGIERLRSQEALGMARRHLEYILSACPAVIYVLQIEGDDVRPTWVSENIVRLTGYDAEATMSFDWWETHLHPEDRQRAVAGLAAMSTQDSCSHEYRVRCKDGTYRWIMDNRRVFRDGGGRSGQAVGAWTDISDRKQLEEQFRQAQKLESIGQLAAGIAHEINTPIQYVGDNVAFLKNVFADIQIVLDKQEQFLGRAKAGTLDEDAIGAFEQAVASADLTYLREEVPRAIEQTLDGVGRVGKIVRAMKEFSHPGYEGKVASDVNRLIDNTITVASNEWKYVADLVRDFDPSLPLVPCLAGELNQVMLNLIVNAAHAIGDSIQADPGRKGIITITTRVAEAGVEIRVKDTGTGIPVEARTRIFDPFFTTKPVGKGTGQGLAIAHAVIVKKHGGRLSFATEMGVGTTFVIHLPLAADAASPEIMALGPKSGLDQALAPTT
jgi:PAS domain S-box-containing protein